MVFNHQRLDNQLKTNNNVKAQHRKSHHLPLLKLIEWDDKPLFKLLIE